MPSQQSAFSTQIHREDSQYPVRHEIEQLAGDMQRMLDRIERCWKGAAKIAPHTGYPATHRSKQNGPA